MKYQKTWLTVNFNEGVSSIELIINYRDKTFSLTHGNNCSNVTFNGNIKDFKKYSDRAKCVTAALLFAKKELE